MKLKIQGSAELAQGWPTFSVKGQVVDASDSAGLVDSLMTKRHGGTAAAVETM